jgi:predicted nuclease of restriction endonuclease-like (RecB) superfamily
MSKRVADPTSSGLALMGKPKPAHRQNERLVMGRSRAGEAQFPAPPQVSDLPKDYAEALEKIKRRIQQERLRVVLSANSAMVVLYWDIGRLILERQRRSGWGAKVVDRMAHDLQQAFPDMRGFSPRNLLFMRSFAEAYADAAIVKQLVSQIPWGQIVRLLQRVKEPRAREWYIRQTIQYGWSRSILQLQIDGRAYERSGKAPTNFKATLPPAKSDMARQLFKDPYLFDFLGTADLRREKEVEQALVDNLQRFLLELGSGFAFVGRQVLLEVGDQDFRDLLRQPSDKPTIGLLLCKSKNRVVVEYALRHLKRPIGVAHWETRIVKALPKDFQGSLPTVEELERELGRSG